jgi:hypothetical protein
MDFEEEEEEYLDLFNTNDKIGKQQHTFHFFNIKHSCWVIWGMI